MTWDGFTRETMEQQLILLLSMDMQLPSFAAFVSGHIANAAALDVALKALDQELRALYERQDLQEDKGNRDLERLVRDWLSPIEHLITSLVVRRLDTLSRHVRQLLQAVCGPSQLRLFPPPMRELFSCSTALHRPLAAGQRVVVLVHPVCLVAPRHRRRHKPRHARRPVVRQVRAR